MANFSKRKDSNSINTDGIIGLVATIREKANKHILNGLKEQRIDDIVPAYGAILVQLFMDSELTMGEIARRIERTKSTATALVTKLVGLGYLEAEKDSVDGRVTKVRLTEKGKALEEDFWEVSRSLLAKTYQGFSEEEKKTLVSLLTRVRDNL